MPLPKVCHIIHQDGPGGGPVFLIDQLAGGSAQFQLSVIHGGSGKVAAYCEQMRLPHWRVAIDRQAMLPFGFCQLVIALREAAPDLVILHGQWAGPVGALAMRVAGIRRSIYIAEWPAFYTDWDLWRVARNRIAEGIPCHLCDRVVTPSRGGWYQYTLRRLGTGKIHLIHHGIDSSRVPTADQIRALRQAQGWDERHTHVVSVGRLADQKCVDWLLRSWSIVQERHPGARCWIVGDGPEEAALRRLARDLKIEDTCTFLGARANGMEYVAAADIVAMTTLYESHGLVALEAMASGRPLVTNDVDGPRDSIREGVEGFLVPPGDIESFAARLELLIGDPALRKSMGEAGRLRAGLFTASGNARQYAALINEVLAL